MTKKQYRLEEWNNVKERANGICEVCGKPVKGGEFAHIIKQGEIKFLGFYFIHSAANGLWTCSTALGFNCNKQADMGNSQDGRYEHIQKVIKYLMNNKNVPPHSFNDSVLHSEFHIIK